MSYGNERLDQAASNFEEIPAIGGGKRCAMQWTPWMGDWFVSWSPRNSNNNAEGPWDHWVDLAIKILSDPLTAIVRQEAYAAAQILRAKDYYDEADRQLTDGELAERFAGGQKP